MTSEAAGAIVVLEAAVGAGAVAAEIPAAAVAVVVVVGGAATGKIDDCRLTIFRLKFSAAVTVFTKS
jgi:hypothetical protein